MSDGHAIDDETLKFGLLMESAQAHQKLAETHLEKLRTHTLGLDEVVRGEIRRTLIEELASLTAETERAAGALRGMKRSVQMRGALWSIAITILCTAIPTVVARWALPTATGINALRAQRDSLSQSVDRLERRGGKAEWRSCGTGARLCVRIDRKAPVYGDDADYYIVKGY